MTVDAVEVEQFVPREVYSIAEARLFDIHVERVEVDTYSGVFGELDEFMGLLGSVEKVVFVAVQNLDTKPTTAPVKIVASI